MTDEAFGIPLEEGLPDGFTPLELVAVVKCLDADGNVAVVGLASPGLNSWEAIGMLSHTEDVLRQALLEDDDGDD